jgi:tRNA A37 threonylcarbamoyltransferase TsaD
LRSAVERLPVPAFMPAMAYCTDNAAMIAGLGHVHLAAGHQDPLTLDAGTR